MALKCHRGQLQASDHQSIPSPGDGHVVLLCCWVRPAPSPAPTVTRTLAVGPLPISIHTASLSPSAPAARAGRDSLSLCCTMSCPQATCPCPPREGFGDTLPLAWLVHRAKGKPASCLHRGAEGMSSRDTAPSQGWGEHVQKCRGEQGQHVMEGEQPLWRCHG